MPWKYMLEQAVIWGTMTWGFIVRDKPWQYTTIIEILVIYVVCLFIWRIGTCAVLDYAVEEVIAPIYLFGAIFFLYCVITLVNPDYEINPQEHPDYIMAADCPEAEWELTICWGTHEYVPVMHGSKEMYLRRNSDNYNRSKIRLKGSFEDVKMQVHEMTNKYAQTFPEKYIDYAYYDLIYMPKDHVINNNYPYYYYDREHFDKIENHRSKFDFSKK